MQCWSKGLYFFFKVNVLPLLPVFTLQSHCSSCWLETGKNHVRTIPKVEFWRPGLTIENLAVKQKSEVGVIEIVVVFNEAQIEHSQFFW